MDQEHQNLQGSCFNLRAAWSLINDEIIELRWNSLDIMDIRVENTLKSDCLKKPLVWEYIEMT